MAIPVPWPSSDDGEDTATLDTLLEQLFDIVRQVLIQRHRQQQQELSHLRNMRQRTMVTQMATAGPAYAAPTETTNQSSEPQAEQRLPLPDLVQETVPDCEAIRRKTPPVAAASSQVSTWVQVGADLRRIADTFRSERAAEQNTTDRKSTALKEASLLSLLCPAITRSLWTTVTLLFSWGR